MRKRILALTLCVLLLLALFPGSTGAAANPLRFVAFNDTMPPELINSTVYYGGAIYVPYWLFTNYNFGISYSYFSSSSTAYLFNSRNQIFFELTSGKTYNSNDVEYSAPAIMWGGTVYLPLAFVCTAFGGFVFRNIGQNEYGSILRITTGSEMLDDGEFFRAASAAMKRYYEAYNGAEPPESTPEPTPEPTPTPQPREGDAIRLGLEGMPSAELLALLEQEGIRACIFLRAEEIRSDPDTVRRIACAGHILGASCPEGSPEQQSETARLLWEAARVRTILFTTPEGAGAQEGVVIFPGTRVDWTADELRDSVYTVMNALEQRTGDQTVIFPCGEGDAAAHRMLLYYIHDQGFTVLPILETDGNGEPPVLPG